MKDFFNSPNFYSVPAGTDSVAKFLDYFESDTNLAKVNEEWKRMNNLLDFTNTLRAKWNNEYYESYKLEN